MKILCKNMAWLIKCIKSGKNNGIEFPQLEQFGDAIYELAVDNIIFYNPNTTLTHQRREDFVKSEAQIKV